MTKINTEKDTKQKAEPVIVTTAQRTIEIKARMFDLMAHRESVNQKVGKELQELHTEITELTKLD